MIYIYIYIYIYTVWAEIIGPSHGFYIFWDTLCIYIYIYTEWAEIIGKSYRFYIFWDTLYIYMYRVSWNTGSVTWVPCILRHPVYIYIYIYIEWTAITDQSYWFYINWDTIYIYIYILSLRKTKPSHIRITNSFPPCYGYWYESITPEITWLLQI